MARNSRIILGLNSGTSADGVDAVACEITGRGLTMRVRVLGHVRSPYARELQERLLRIMAPAATRTEELCRLETEAGRAFADAAAAAVKKIGLKHLDLIGSHGQTICHLPPSGGKARSAAATLQLGDPAIIAARLRVPVVARFRQADMAEGGQGAPLVPWTDYVLFGHRKKNRVVQNIGGIANLTWLPAGGDVEDVTGFDTGPGNMVIDALVRHFTRGRRHFDRGGRQAARGRPDARVLKGLLNHPFLTREPPRSCGREEFGESWVRRVLKRNATRRLSAEDWLATATMFTAVSITLAYISFLGPRRGGYPPMDEIILCGGGERNPTLVRRLAECVSFNGRFDSVPISTTADYGIPTEAKEGVSFAMLAAACADRVPANLPQVTGARRRVVLGQISNPEPYP
ncbi:MAG TPA: anhydro-N-acetylmuramic acid kinase [Phycisphaerae bacterium]|nr:anhydro-N-acetylmuramic acid kinase [Phycisphaerae bacterium]